MFDSNYDASYMCATICVSGLSCVQKHKLAVSPYIQNVDGFLHSSSTTSGTCSRSCPTFIKFSFV